MFLPKGQPIYENLKTVVTKFDMLVSELTSNRFTGYLRVTEPDYDGALFFNEGKVISALDDLDGQRRSGSVSAKALAAKGRAQEGLINIHAMPLKTLLFLSEIAQAHLVHENLLSDYTNLGKLIEQQKNDKHASCIEVTANDNNSNGFILFRPGQPIESFVCANGETNSDENSLMEIFSLVSKVGAKYNVYLANGLPAGHKTMKTETSLQKHQELVIWEKILNCVEKTVNGRLPKDPFLYAFKRAMTEKGRDFPFLLYTTGEFAYADGKITYDGDFERLSEGLGVCLSGAVISLDAQKPKANLLISVKEALIPIRLEHADAIQKFGLTDKCDLLKVSLYDQVVASAIPVLGKNAKRFIEKQCLKKLGISPANVTAKHLESLAQKIEDAAALTVSREKAKALRQTIASLGRKT